MPSRDAATTPGPCVFPRCVKGEQPSYCGHDCDVREKPYEHEYGTPADGLAACEHGYTGDERNLCACDACDDYPFNAIK